MSTKCFFVAIAFMLCSMATFAQRPVMIEGEFYSQVTEDDTVIVKYSKCYIGYLDNRFCVYIDYAKCYYNLAFYSKNEQNVTTHIGTSEQGDRYSITHIVSDQGFTVMLCNLDRKFPHIVISTVRPVQYKEVEQEQLTPIR